MDPSTGKGTFSDLTLPETGGAFLMIHFTSNPADYSFQVMSSWIDVHSADYVAPVVEEEKTAVITFLEPFSRLAGKENQFKGVLYNAMLSDFTSVLISFVSLSEGVCNISTNCDI